jgi:hypothetical protein
MRATLIAVLTAACLHAQDVPEGLSASDWSSIRAAYEAGRHQVRAVDGGHQARSPGQQWLARFDGRGVVVRPDAGEWSWGLELVAFGFAGDERAVAVPRSAQADGQRLTYRFDDALDEWYVNGTGGLEHGYTLHARPAGDGTLTFLVRVRGDLAPVVQNSGRDVVFQQGGETRLAYTGLHVFDADGRTLPARFSVQPHGLLLSIDERGARYPVTVDPIAQHAYLKASNSGASDAFGHSAAVSGNTVVIGAPYEDSNAMGVNGNQADNTASNSGAAYVFVRSGSAWSQQAYLKASNTGVNDSFGDSVSVSEDTVVVGAHNEDSNATGVNGNQVDNNATNSGAAYVFVRSGSAWSQQAYLKASNAEGPDLFGDSVAVSGNTIVVGADNEASNATGVNGNGANNSATSSGAAYVFVRSGTTWSQQAYLKASNPGAFDYFGYSVAVSGDTVVVGAAYEDSNATGINGNPLDNSLLGAGAAYVFVRNGSSWSQQAYLKASNPDAFDAFGRSVAVSGDTVVVNAYLEDSSASGVNGNQADNSAHDSGAAYVFVRNGTSWTQQAYLKASNTDATDYFGWSVAVSGDTVVVGAVAEDSSARGASVHSDQLDNSAFGAGAAYVFVRSGTTWTQLAYLKASNSDASDQFGQSVAVSGDTVVVGASQEDSSAFAAGPGVTGSQFDNNTPLSGSAYIFDLRSGSFGSLPAVAQQVYVKASNTDADDEFGRSVAVSGDTVVVGAPFEASDANGVNGDQTDNSTTRAGAAYVFVRNGSSWSQQAYLKASNSNSYDYFGCSVSVSGDFVVVGAYGEDSNTIGVDGNQFDNSMTRAGAAYVFARYGSTWSQQAYLKASNTNAIDLFGWSVAVSGATIVVGAPLEDSSASSVNGNHLDNSATDAGAAYVFVRNGSSWSQQAYLKASNSDPLDYFGYSVAMSGDTIVAGAYGEHSNSTGVDGNPFNNSAAAAGAAYVFVRHGVAWSQQAYLKASNTDVGDYFGYSVAVSGNTVVVGAHEEDGSATGVDGNAFDNSSAAAGAAYVFVRNGASWSQQAYLKASNTDVGDAFGYSVSVSGDTAVVSAYLEDSSATGVTGNQADNNAADSGAAYVFRRCGTMWTQRTYLKASNTGADDHFGLSVAVSGDQLVVGAIGESSNATDVDGNQADNSAPLAGAAYVFSLARARPSLWPLNAPQIGQSYTLAIDHLEPTLNFAVLVFGFFPLPLPGIDLGPILGMPCCDLYHTPDALLSVAPGAGGSAAWTWAPVTGLPGDTLYCQALCFDPLANAFGFTLSNQITIRLVP